VLQGSLQTVAIPEVLQFLESTSKTGELAVSGPSGHGRLWFDSGVVSAFETHSSREPAEAVFELMGISDGEFVFTAAERSQPAPTARTARRQVGPLIAEAQALQEEWSAIVGVVPSLDHHVELVADPPSDPVTLGRAQWAAVVAVGSGRSVADVIAGCDLSEIAGCRVIRDLVEAGVAAITQKSAVVSEPDVAYVPAETVAGGAASYDELTGPAGPAGPAGDVPSTFREPASDPGGILGFDFGTLIADFPVPAATASHDEPEDDQPEASAVAPEVTFADLDDLASPKVELDAPEPSAEDRYAALRAAMLEVGENLGGDDDTAGSYTSDDQYGGATFDALADRGPWSDSELAQIHESGMWDAASSADGQGFYDGQLESAEASPAEPSEASEDPSVDEADGGDGTEDEPINRGLLLKFLSSVRN
jgi:hypothetical protein